MFDRVGDDALIVRDRYLAVNGDHPMTEVDDTYVRSGFVPATDEQLALMAAGRVPLPSYLLSDGTPMVPRDHLDPLGWAGGAERLHDWFVGYWPADEQDEAEREWAAYLSGRYVCLQHVTPVGIRDKARWTGRLEEASARLARSPRDHVARGMLGEAVARLERLLRPQTSYDALRFGAAGHVAARPAGARGAPDPRPARPPAAYRPAGAAPSDGGGRRRHARLLRP